MYSITYPQAPFYSLKSPRLGSKVEGFRVKEFPDCIYLSAFTEHGHLISNSIPLVTLYSLHSYAMIYR